MNRPSPPPEAAKVIEAALDVFVYAPIGFLLDARDVVPKLAERGRGQVTLARMFGRYALQLGQAEAERVLSCQRRDGAAAPATTPDDATMAAPPTTAGTAATVDAEPSATEVARADIAAPRSPGESPAGESPPADQSPADESPADESPADEANVFAPATPAAAQAIVAEVPSANDLPIPAYDTLSASQVVPRLEALLPNELEAVRAYEAAHRGRRTILNRIAQRLA